MCFTLIIGGGRLGWAEDHDAFSLPTFQGAPKRRTLIRQLRDWYRTQRAGQRGLAKRLLKDLYELKQDLGIPNVLVAARALVVFGDQACRDKRWKHAVDYYREAIHFAPMVAGAHYRLGWSIWRENWHNWNRALSSFRRGFTLEWNEPLHRARRIEQLGLFVLCVVLLLWGVFWLGLFLRTLRLFEADFFQFFPVGVTLIQVRLLILILLSVPFFLGLGWIEILCCLLLTSWFYQKYTERLFSSLGLIVLSCIPLGLTYVIRARSVSRSIYLSSYVLSQTEGTKTNIKQVQKLLKKRRRDVRLLWSLGLYYKRQGKIEQARALFLRAKKQGPWPGIRLNLGNLDFLQQKSDTAFKTYRKLLNQTSVRTEVYYNLGQLFRHGKTTKLLQRGGEYRNAALFGPKAELVSQFNKNQKVQINRYLFDVLPPQRLFWHRLFHHPSQSDLSLWWMSFSSIIPLSWVGFVLLGLGLGLWLLLPFKHWICRSDVCDRCGLMSL
ncbi:MAG: tetratricopeptide repeat protein, partial [Myxococcota bacterium]